MNYIFETKAFYDWLETNPLSSSAINMWHALMHIANKTGWQPTFAVAISVLEVKTGLKKQALQGARNALKQAGRIEWESRSGNQSAIYRIIPFADFKQPQMEAQQAKPRIAVAKQPQGDTQEQPQPDTQGDTQPHSITKLNKTKLDKDKKNNGDLKNQVQEIWDYYNEVFGSFYPRGLTLTDIRRTKISARLKSGQPVELIKAAIDNIRKSPWHCGDNPGNKVYATIDFICRNDGMVEEWANHNPKGGAASGQNSGGLLGSGGRKGATVSTDKGSGVYSSAYD